VGSLIPRKGHHLAIEAVARCPDCTLLIAGDGPLRPALAALADRLGARERVRLLGETPHAQLPSLYGAADVLLLASEREGWANVLLEAMACGTPVIATDVNGTAEVVKSPEAGRLVTKRSPAAIVEALTELRASMPRRDETRAYAEKFGWHPIAQANSALLRSVAEARMEGRDDDKILAHILERLAAAEAAQPNA
jgi:teichuronic acid biosynthesis glycosyltransferase TuaC